MKTSFTFSCFCCSTELSMTAAHHSLNSCSEALRTGNTTVFQRFIPGNLLCGNLCHIPNTDSQLSGLRCWAASWANFPSITMSHYSWRRQNQWCRDFSKKKAKGTVTGNRTGSILIISTYLENENGERGYLMNQESMHTGVRSGLNSREVCYKAHKTKPKKRKNVILKSKK